jgi:predicted dithiol-disulfide oxidoreductase (DUF899 family)
MAPDQVLRPAKELAAKNGVRFPNESDEYRQARDALLAEEIELRRHIERVAEQRRRLPPGGGVGNYRFESENGPVSFAELFGDKQSLVLYSYMYGPQRERPCPMCTNWLGGVNGNARDIKQRAALKILGRSTVERQKAFAIERGWRDLDFVQTIGDEYADDLGLLDDEGNESPAFIVYRKHGDDVRLFYSAEMPFAAADPGQDPRTAPDIAPLWNVLDLTPEGRGTDWYPSLSY